jgi:hypothetical protein
LHVRIALLIFLAFIFCLPACAWQQSIGGAASSSGNISLPVYDRAGRVVAVTDSTGNTVRPSGGTATPTAVAAHAVNLITAAAPVTIHVPADQPTIQAAIDAAADGDTVLVSDGTYNENINFNGKAITVTSLNGPATTTIDGGGIDSVVTFKTGEGAGSVLNGFTITHGNVSPLEGGGIFVSSSSPTITNNVITANAACTGGGGIAINFAAPLVQGNTINNNAQSGCTGGIGGGGISIGGESSGARVIGNIISNNNWGSGGGGISLFAAGGPLIQNNIITGNNGGNQGGGLVMFNNASPQIIGNVFSHNSAFNGGGLYWLIPQSFPGILLLNNTITNNSATQGSAVFADAFDANASIQNNVIIGQAGVDSVFCGNFNNTTPPGFTANNVFVAGAAPYGGICSDQTGVQGNISADPLFVDTAVDNFHLQPASPAINAGNNTARVALPATDIDGNTRVFNSTIDIGAFEFQGATTATFSSTSLTFPDTLLGTTSAAQNVTITNTGATALQITPFDITAEFTETDDCHTSHGLAVGKTCTIIISFAPNATGPQTGTLTVASNEAASPTIIHLSGVGIGPIVSLSPTSLSFANQRVGVTSSSQPVLLKNTGVTALAIANIMATGDFAQTNDCGSTVGVGASCTINVTFTPTLRGTRNGAVAITDNAAASPQQVILQGQGTGPAATLGAASVSFAGQLVGTTSTAQAVTLTSSGETALAITSITASGDFTQTNDCPSSLPNGQSCTLQITFKPTARGIRNGSLNVVDDATTSPEQVSLSGAGIAPVVSLSQTSLAFGAQVLNVSVTGTVNLNNIGDAPLAISSIAAGGDFTQNNNCPASLAAQAGCTVSITFQPTVAGLRGGTLTLTNSATDSPQSLPLSGTGVQLGFSSSSLLFGNQVVGTTSVVQTVIVTNPGNSPLAITAITASPAFSEANTCGTTLAGNSTCHFDVTFGPTSTGPQNGAITLNYNGTQSSVGVSGNGTDFGIGTAQGGNTSVTITAGSTATYNLSLSGTSGFTGTVNFACAGAPAAATCSVNPSSLALNGTSPANFSVTVSTTPRSSAFAFPPVFPKPFLFNLGLLALAFLATFALATLSRATVRRETGRLAAVLGLLLVVAGCGGGSTTKPPVQTGTPAGTSTITVTATSGSATRTSTLTLIVN